VNRWVGPKTDDGTSRLRWNITGEYGEVPELKREDLAGLAQWFKDELFVLHKETED
jgi:hypothetical protein